MCTSLASIFAIARVGLYFGSANSRVACTGASNAIKIEFNRAEFHEFSKRTSSAAEPFNQLRITAAHRRMVMPAKLPRCRFDRAHVV